MRMYHYMLRSLCPFHLSAVKPFQDFVLHMKLCNTTHYSPGEILHRISGFSTSLDYMKQVSRSQLLQKVISGT